MINDGFELSSKYFKNEGGFIFSQRPNYNTPLSIVNMKTHNDYDQNHLAEMMISATVSIANNNFNDIIIILT